MKKLLLGLCFVVSAFAQTNVQKGAGNVISNGNIVIGNNTSLTATGSGSIIATGGTASSLPWSGLTAIPSPTLTLTGDATGNATLSASGGVSAALTLPTINSNVGTFAGIMVNGKGQVTAANTLTISTTSPLTGGGTLGNLTLSMPAANATTNGYLTSTDWSTFNGKQAAGNYVTALTGDVSATGPGSVAATLATVATAGTTGSSTAIPVITIDAKGRTLSLSTAAVVAPAGTLTGTTLASNVVSSSLTSLGNLTGLTTGTVIGTSATNAFNVAAGITPFTELEADSTSTSSPRGIMSAQFNTGTDGARFHFRKARGTRASPTTVVSGDNLGRLVGTGYDGTSYLEMASIYFATEGTIATNRVPTNISFWTSTDASTSVLTRRMLIDSAGLITIDSGNLAATALTNLTLNGGSSGASLTLGQGANGSVTIAPLGTGQVNISGTNANLLTISNTSVSSISALLLRNSSGTAVGAFGFGNASASSFAGKLFIGGAGNYGVVIANGSAGAQQSEFTNTGNLLIGTTTDASSLSGGLVVNGSGSGATASSTTTGALRVTGGGGFTGALYVGGNVVGSALIDSGGLRATGNTQAGSGTGLELRWDGTSGIVMTYDRTGAAYKPTVIYGSSITIGNGTGQPTTVSGNLTVLTTTEATTGGVGSLTTAGGIYAAKKIITASGYTALGGTTPLMTSSSTWTSGAAAQTGTLTNAPLAGNPTSWIPINDNGTTRYIPAW